MQGHDGDAVDPTDHSAVDLVPLLLFMGDEQTKTLPINNQAALPPGRSVGGDLADVVCILTGLTCLTLVPQVSRSDGPARVFSSIQEARDDASSSRNRDIKDRFVSIGGKGFRCADTAP